MCKKLGADICINPINDNVKNVLKQRGIDRISTVMMLGLTAPDDTISVKLFEIFQKEIVLRSSFINPYTQYRAVELIDSGKIDVSSIVYSYEELEKLPEILSNPQLRSKGKYIIKL